jgi:competence protein ComEC
VAGCCLPDREAVVSSIAFGTFLAGVSLGASAGARAYSPTLLTWFEQYRPARPVVLHGVFEEDAAPGPFGVSVHVRVSRVAAGASSTDVDGGVRLSVAGSLAAAHSSRWRAGRHVALTAALREPAIYLNPGVPDDRERLARRGVVLVGTVKSSALVEVTAPGSPLSELAVRCRSWTRRHLARDVGYWSRRSGSVAAAILLGDRTGLSDEDERRLQEAGTYHVIAISGGNIALLTALLFGALRALRVPHRAAAVLAILLLQFYGLLVTSGPSVDRAITAATLYLAARVLDHRGSPINVLATAAVLAVARSPLATFDPGFILSFGATLGILGGVPKLIALMRPRRGPVRMVLGVLAATISAEIVLAPVAAALFSRITVAGLLLNFAAIPLMTVIQAGSLAALASSFYDPIALNAGRIVHLAVEALLGSARLVDVAPWLSRSTAPPAWWLLFAYYAALAAAVAMPRLLRPAAALVAATAALIYAGCPLTSRDVVPDPQPGAMRVVFIDVGQGDATLVMLPGGRAMLVDAGGFPIPALQDAESGHAAGFDIGERVVAPALRAFGVRALDALVLTHGDPDHVGGAMSVLRLFRPRAVWEGVQVAAHRDLDALGAAADRIGAERRGVVAGDRVQLGAVQIRVLHPPIPEWERQRVRNEDSVVLEIRLGDVAVILPGDIGKEGEDAVLPHLSSARLVVLKAPHHGSATSSTAPFLEALRPAAAIFSAGRANRFGHPAPGVVARYRAMGVEMFSTAQDGAVIVDTDGTSVDIRGWVGRRVVIGR